MIIFRHFSKAKNYELSNYVLCNVVISFSCVRGLKRVIAEDSTKMAPNKRFFLNNLPDYNNQTVSVPQNWLVQKIQELISSIERHERPDVRKADGGLYVGIGGIAYMYYHLSKIVAFYDRRQEYLKKGLEYILAAKEYTCGTQVRDPADLTGFLLGSAGIHAVAAALYKELGDEKNEENSLTNYQGIAKVCKRVNFLPYGGDELFVGRTGYICGALWLEKVVGRKVVPDNDINDLCTSIMESGRRNVQAHRRPLSPLSYSYYDTEYLGAAHGWSAILQYLLSCPNFLAQSSESVSYIKGTVDFMLSLQGDNGNFPCAMDEVQHKRAESDELVHWCHGAPGVVYLMGKAYLVWKEEKYLRACLKCGEVVWKKGLLKKGPGICHGVAGNGYVFLLLYRLTGDSKHLHRAIKFAEFMFTPEFNKGARTPDSPYSLYEGLAGTVCYLGDLLQPEKAAFPFMDIF